MYEKAVPYMLQQKKSQNVGNIFLYSNLDMRIFWKLVHMQISNITNNIVTVQRNIILVQRLKLTTFQQEPYQPNTCFIRSRRDEKRLKSSNDSLMSLSWPLTVIRPMEKAVTDAWIVGTSRIAFSKLKVLVYVVGLNAATSVHEYEYTLERLLWKFIRLYIIFYFYIK